MASQCLLSFSVGRGILGASALAPGWMHPVARIRKSRALTAHLIHAKTEQMLHLLLESGFASNHIDRVAGSWDIVLSGSKVMRSVIYAVITFYMLMVLARWAAPWIRLNLQSREWRWVYVATDPALRQVRRMMPDMGGAMDWSFPALLMVLWLIRMLITGQ